MDYVVSLGTQLLICSLMCLVSLPLRLLTEVYAQRTAWRRSEERVANAPSSQPDAVIRLEASERTPLAAKVLEGTGTAIGIDGMPLPVVQGSIVPPGAKLYGGPFVLKLEHEK